MFKLFLQWLGWVTLLISLPIAVLLAFCNATIIKDVELDKKVKKQLRKSPKGIVADFKNWCRIKGISKAYMKDFNNYIGEE